MITLLKRMRGHLTIGIMTVGTLFCFMLVAADRVSASTFQTVNGEVVIEAENYTRLGGTTGGTWYLNNEITGYRGSGYIQSTTDDPTTLDFSSSIIRAEYDIDFKETGTYYLHLRTYATDHSNNGFFAAVDGQSFDYGHPDAYYIAVYWMNQWWWYNDGGGAGSRGYNVSINITNTGVQKLALYRRDKGTRIDRIWLTKHQDVPQDTGTLTLPDPSIFQEEINTHTVNMSFAGLGVGALSSEPSGIACYGTNGDSCDGSFDPDSEVILTASPEIGSIFTGWGGDCGGVLGRVCTLYIDRDKNVQANFVLQGQANPIGDIRVENLTTEERDFFMNIADGERQFPIDSSIEVVFFQNNTARIDFRNGASKTVMVTDGGRYSEDFINLVFLNGNSAGEIFATLLELPSFEARVNSAGDLAQLYYPGVILPIGDSPGMRVVDLALLKLKSVGQPSIFFRYRENARDAVVDGDFWITEHLQDTILLPGQTIDPGKMVDLYLVVKDNGLYDLDGANEIIVDPLVLGVIQESSIPPSPTGSGGGGCFIGTSTDRFF